MAEIKPYSCKPRAPIETYTELGSKYKILTRFYVDENGQQCAEPGDKLDLDAMIQASKASTDIATIIAKLENGDESVINVGTPMYGDMVSLPHNVNDVVALDGIADRVKGQFDTLPADLKAMFGNDYRKFAIAVLENKADSVIQSYLSNTQATPAAAPAPAESGTQGE